MVSRPDVLVLGAGGVLGEAWLMGVLAGIEDATGFDLRACEYLVGTSAGSIVAAHLIAGRTPRRPSAPGEQPEAQSPEHRPEPPLAPAARRAARRASRWALSAGAPFAPLALSAASPGGAVVRSALLQRLPRARGSLGDLRVNVERSGARFDGRLRVAAVDRRSGRRVMFGSPGSPHASVGQAVEASCTVPWMFAPVSIGGREYVDGGAWSVTNLDAAPAGRDTHVLCLNPTAAITGHALMSVARGFSRSAVSFEALVLRRRGALVQIFGPDAPAAAAMGANFMDPARRKRVLASGYRQGLSLGAPDVPAVG